MEGSNQYSGLLGRISGAEIVVVSIEQDRFYPGIPLAGAAAAYVPPTLPRTDRSRRIFSTVMVAVCCTGSEVQLVSPS